MFDTVFAFVHLGGLLAALGYAIWSLTLGRAGRAGLILALLTLYYLFILHPAVKKEIARRKSLRK